jgi:hypothetical protein
VRCNTSGDIYQVYSYLYYGSGTGSGNSVILTSIQPDIWYDFWFHARKSATTGGASCKLGSWGISAIAYNKDNSAKNGFGTIRMGGGSSVKWGDGTTDTFVRMDDFEVFKRDARE